jgi:hypothetical protein
MFTVYVVVAWNVTGSKTTAEWLTSEKRAVPNTWLAGLMENANKQEASFLVRSAHGGTPAGEKVLLAASLSTTVMKPVYVLE